MVRRTFALLAISLAVGGFTAPAAQAHCVVNAGTCTSNGHCAVNTGYCAGTCTVNAGVCVANIYEVNCVVGGHCLVK